MRRWLQEPARRCPCCRLSSGTCSCRLRRARSWRQARRRSNRGRAWPRPSCVSTTTCCGSGRAWTASSASSGPTSKRVPRLTAARGACCCRPRFLAAAFRAFERRSAATGRCDEHALRRRLIAEGLARPFVGAVVTLPDEAADPDGLWPADFDLLTRMEGLERIDVVADRCRARRRLSRAAARSPAGH